MGFLLQATLQCGPLAGVQALRNDMLNVMVFELKFPLEELGHCHKCGVITRSDDSAQNSLITPQAISCGCCSVIDNLYLLFSVVVVP